MREGLCFSDVLLVPNFSKVKSRSNVDLSVKMGSFKFSHPIIPANMKTISGELMCVVNSKRGGLSIFHRFDDIKTQLKTISYLKSLKLLDNFSISVGIKEEDKENLKKFNELGIKIVCIDIAHGDSQGCLDMIAHIKSNYPNLFIIAGNIATSKAAKALWNEGAQAVKVGVGGGAICSTRIETGNGVPQLTALMDISELRNLHYKDKFIISDGGCNSAGDIVKALCFADMVMTGSLFAGCEQTPGTEVEIEGKLYKEYVGSSTHKTSHIEGIKSLVTVKGSYHTVLQKLLDGISSGCSYQGVDNLIDLKDNPEFIKSSSAGLRESHPRGSAPENYEFKG